jgi:hypothetical protein
VLCHDLNKRPSLTTSTILFYLKPLSLSLSLTFITHTLSLVLILSLSLHFPILLFLIHHLCLPMISAYLSWILMVFLFLRKSWKIKDLNNFLALTQKNLRAESGWYVLWGDNIIVIKYMGLFHISFDLIYRCKNQVLN